MKLISHFCHLPSESGFRQLKLHECRLGKTSPLIPVFTPFLSLDSSFNFIEFVFLNCCSSVYRKRIVSKRGHVNVGKTRVSKRQNLRKKDDISTLVVLPVAKYLDGLMGEKSIPGTE
jgi:hypothetical protein